MFEIIYSLLTFSLLLNNVQSNGPPTTVRQTANGNVKGIEETSSMGQKYYAFRSVPYAETPITGTDPYTNKTVDRRFKAPEPLTRKWGSNLRVHKLKNSCLESTRLIPTKQPTGEDCLFLQIYVPAGGVKKKTVLFFVHGGGFTEGGHREGLYGPDFLLAEDNVVVVVQYRLGIFGFLNLGQGNYTGNMGLKDQQMALKWVYENIEFFSGNKRKILLFGESAGGASTTFHMLNEESRKYFRRAYSMSGTVYSYFALTKGDHVKKIQLCARTNNMNEIIKYIQTSDGKNLIQCYFKDDWGATLKPEWVPTIEKPGTVNGFITESPDVIWKSKKAPIIDTLFSFVSEEQVTFDPSLVTRPTPLIRANGKSSIRLPFDDFNRTNHPQLFNDAIMTLRRNYYSGSTSPDIIKIENIALMSDLNFGDSVLKAVKLQADANGQKKNTFLFRFGVNAKLNWIKTVHEASHFGAAHADELCYIFHCHVLDEQGVYDAVLKDKDSVSYKTIKRIVKTITNFARTGNPSVKGDTPFKRIESSSNIFCQEMTNDPISTVTTDIEKQLRYDAWRELEYIYEHKGAPVV